VTVQDSAPIDSTNGDLWYDSSSANHGGRLYMYYRDRDADQWVDVSMPGGGSFLLLDASNGPVTGKCEFSQGISVTGGGSSFTFAETGLLYDEFSTPGNEKLILKHNNNVGSSIVLDQRGVIELRGNTTTGNGTTAVAALGKVATTESTEWYGFRSQVIPNEDQTPPGQNILSVGEFNQITSWATMYSNNTAVGIYRHFLAEVGPQEVGTRTEIRGYEAHSQLGELAEATAYGFYSNLAAGTGPKKVFNFYANSSAPNYAKGTFIWGESDELSDYGGSNNPEGKLIVSGSNSDERYVMRCWARNTNTQFHFTFHNNNTNTGEVGSISTNGSSTSFTTSSDYRLKENIVPLSGAIDRVMALKPSRFNFISDKNTVVDGFIAHEAQEVVPEAVVGEKDGEKMQSIDQSKLVPLLTAALQEALEKMAEYETRLAALEA